MNLNDVLSLAKSGFTSTQITALMQLQTPVAPVTPIAPVMQTVPQMPPVQPVTPIAPVTPVTPVAPVTQSLPVPQTPQANLDPIMVEIQRLTSAMQTTNVLNSSLPTPENTDDILALIINPKEVSK